MTVHYHQLSLAETFKECQELLVDNTPSFFLLLKEHLDFDAFISHQFDTAFYKHFGRKRTYPLHGFL
ncbi:MAG: hypothetical protein RSD63_03660 [Eubacterium sp.]